MAKVTRLPKRKLAPKAEPPEDPREGIPENVALMPIRSEEELEKMLEGVSIVTDEPPPKKGR